MLLLQTDISFLMLHFYLSIFRDRSVLVCLLFPAALLTIFIFAMCCQKQKLVSLKKDLRNSSGQVFE